MSRSLSPDQIAEKKAELVSAAIEILETEGHQALTVRNLADKAGISRTTPYLYFENKEALLDAVCIWCFRNLIESCREVVNNGDKSVEQMRDLGDIYIRFGLDHPILYDLIFMVARPETELDEELLAAIDEYTAVSSEPLARAYDEGLLVLPPERLNPVLWSTSHGMMTLYRLGHFGTEDALMRIREDLGRVISAGFLTDKGRGKCD